MQFVNIQFTGDKALYPAFGELMAHENADVLSAPGIKVPMKCARSYFLLYIILRLYCILLYYTILY